MNKRPAYEEVEIAIGTASVRLRPSLRAAANLEQEFGLPGLIEQALQCHLGNTAKIIRRCAIDRKEAEALVAAIHQAPISEIADALTEPLFRLINGFVPRQEETQKAATGKPTPWAEFYRQLYRLGAGWLGWTPETTWNATPTEITEALDGLHAKLKALHGGTDNTDEAKTYSPEQLKEIEDLGYDPAFDREGLHNLRDKLKRGK